MTPNFLVPSVPKIPKKSKPILSTRHRSSSTANMIPQQQSRLSRHAGFVLCCWCHDFSCITAAIGPPAPFFRTPFLDFLKTASGYWPTRGSYWRATSSYCQASNLVLANRQRSPTNHSQPSSDIRGYWEDTHMRASQEHCTRDSSVAVTDVTDQTENWCVSRTTMNRLRLATKVGKKCRRLTAPS